ncbi:MAG: adenylyl-sulfate kinase [Alphaproteobacteria bacterium]
MTTQTHALRDQLRLVVVGHVDHGKSTLIGRLLYDTDSLPAGKFEELKDICDKRGMPLEWSFVLDAFQAERDQAITIDTTQIWFKTDQRDVVIIDAPGHREFLKNMISGAAQADAAVLVVDADEGVKEQTRRHAYLLNLLGMKHITVVVNKMDMVGFSQTRFAEVSQEVQAYLSSIGLSAEVVIPISARHGQNIASLAPDDMSWFDGPCLIDAIDRFEARRTAVDLPLRFPVQDVYKFDERRIIVGRVESGVLRVGDEIIFSPHNRTARIKSIEVWNSDDRKMEAHAGEVIGITLEEQIFVERGDVASRIDNAPMLTNVFRANLFWLGDKKLEEGKTFKLKHLTGEADVTVQEIERVVDTQSLAGAKQAGVDRNDVGQVVFRSKKLLAVDPYTNNPIAGRVVLVDGYDIVGGGLISMEGYPDQRQSMQVKGTNLYEVDHLLGRNSRAMRNGHDGAVIWLTGLSGSGKSTIAMRVEQRLFHKGYQTYVLDGDNVRQGLCADLGFAPEDRAENIRRIGEVAGLFADAGVIVLSAFISPYRDDRARARACSPDLFHEVHIKADVETCAGRDPKGLYKRAMAGEIPEFTGVSAPYEAPEEADLVVDTASMEIEQSVDMLVEYIEQHISTVGKFRKTA